MLTVSTVNVNGLRAAVKKGFVEWLAATKADVVTCQEVRAEADQLPASVTNPEGWFALHAPSEIKGRNGVAIYSRVEPDEVRVGFGEPEFEQSGRYLEAHPELHTLFWDATKLAGAAGAKGQQDPAVAQQLLDKIAEIDAIFWETKKA